MRRRRFEIDLARFLRIDQQWRRRDDGTVWTVVQIHRLDCEVELRRDRHRELVTFEQLRKDWKWIASAPGPMERVLVPKPCCCATEIPGAKPVGFCHWLFNALGAQPGDELVDIFPGSGAVSAAWDAWRAQGVLAA